MKRIAIFASGSGTNAQNIIEYFKNSREITVDSLWSNNEDAYALIRAERLGVETFTFGAEELYQSIEILEELSDRKVDLIVLAGFLMLMPANLTEEFTTVNVHPALLPKYGGKGMYGMHVHQAVIRNQEKQSGMTVHLVNDRYDSGKIIFQATCDVLPDDTAESLAERVHKLEYEHYPRVIEQVLLNETGETDA